MSRRGERPIGRTVAAIVAAFVVNVAVVAAGRAIAFSIWPVHGVDAASMMPSMPLAAKLVVVATWGLGALFAGVAAAVIARRGWLAWVGGSITLIGVVADAFNLPYPGWMVVAGLVLPVLAAYAASRLVPWHNSRQR